MFTPLVGHTLRRRKTETNSEICEATNEDADVVVNTEYCFRMLPPPPSFTDAGEYSYLSIRGQSFANPNLLPSSRIYGFPVENCDQLHF